MINQFAVLESIAKPQSPEITQMGDAVSFSLMYFADS
jgi:hypothetical protein